MSWDRDLVYEQGVAMGEEFKAKGAHVQLGPGMNVQRVPTNGRAFEYISGEDPVVGRELVPPIIKGIQSTKVLANAKHFIDNSQETNRFTVNEKVDERTNFEMYYPPFQAAIDADVGSFMCSYNKINGKWSCENDEEIGLHLRAFMGFKGYVMSDWGATHSVSINAGLDQE
jgi:beta-glucosidase